MRRDCPLERLARTVPDHSPADARRPAPRHLAHPPGLLRALLVAGCMTAAALGPSPVGAQAADVRAALSAPARAAVDRLGAASGAAGTVGDRLAAPGRVAPWTPLASALVPGAGQLLARDERGAAYLALEAFLVYRYVSSRRDAREQRDAYREIARSYARAPFGGTVPASDFEYYETLRDTRFVESGAYDAVPGGPVDPETADSTFNGFVWALARHTYFRNPNVTPDRRSPEYQRAIALYNERAVRDDRRWSWRNQQIQRDNYTSTIARSNAAYRQAARYLGAVIANHALSTIDAFISVRVRSAGADGRVGLDGSVPWAPFGRGRPTVGAVDAGR